MDHQADFKWLAMEKLGADVAAAIDWCTPRLLCVAATFTKFDHHAVQQIQRHIELLRYRRFGGDLLLLELAYANNGTLEKRTPEPTEAVALADNSATTHGSRQAHASAPKPQGPYKSFAGIKATLPEPLLQTLAAREDLLQSFCDDVQCKELCLYTAAQLCLGGASALSPVGVFTPGRYCLHSANSAPHSCSA